jgi:hypothetical protein
MCRLPFAFVVAESEPLKQVQDSPQKCWFRRQKRRGGKREVASSGNWPGAGFLSQRVCSWQLSDCERVLEILCWLRFEEGPSLLLCRPRFFGGTLLDDREIEPRSPALRNKK